MAITYQAEKLRPDGGLLPGSLLFIPMNLIQNHGVINVKPCHVKFCKVSSALLSANQPQNGMRSLRRPGCKPVVAAGDGRKIHSPLYWGRALSSSASISATVGRLPFKFLGRDSTSLVCHWATPTGFSQSRNAYSTVRWSRYGHTRAGWRECPAWSRAGDYVPTAVPKWALAEPI